LGFSQLLKMVEDLALPEISKSNIDHIITAGYHLFALVEDVLDISRIEAGKLFLKIESIEVALLLNKTLL
jgi:signal transduction histidine kinase